MRLGLIAYGWDRPRLGIGRYATSLFREFAAEKGDIEFDLLAAGSAGELGNRASRVHQLPGCRLLPGLLTLGNFTVARAAGRAGLDLVHDPSGVAPFASASGAATVVTIHDAFPLVFPASSSILEKIMYRYWLPRVLSGVDAVITDSSVSKYDIHHSLDVRLGKIHVIHPGIDEEFSEELEWRRTAVRDDVDHHNDGYILYVGSVERRKNIHGLLEAYRRLSQEIEPPKLLLAGPRRGVYPELDELLADPALSSRVELLGHVSGRPLVTLYKNAKLFAFPSFYEGFGFPPLEAMASGTPVVASTGGSLPEVLGEAALLVEPDDHEGLAHAIERMLKDRDLRTDMIARGRERAAQFTWARTAAETLQVYRSVLSS